MPLGRSVGHPASTLTNARLVAKLIVGHTRLSTLRRLPEVANGAD